MRAKTDISHARVGRNGVQTNLRLPEEVRNRLMIEAEKNRRSFSAEVIQRLIESLGMEQSSMAEADDLVHFKLRLSKELHAVIAEMAARDNRSMSAQIVHIVELFVRTESAESQLRGGEL
ncbi:Arc family DNA-binding protein [Lysobacter enzymogenes]|uniref:Arc family DNA-binding protein n=1 Tax=Lysobacter enzymogenes TaxID=69 RepID=UPI0009436518|nr:Arc family DNA-binding protein [Lysobacter enzymogenes]